MSSQAQGPIDASHASFARLRTLPRRAINLRKGFWSSIQEVNRRVSLLHGHRMLEESGNLDAFRIAAGDLDAKPRGPVFRDSDLYKWLEAVSWELGRETNAELMQLADKAIDLIERSQCEDGYLNTFFQIEAPDRRWTNLRDDHELYCAGHLMQAAVAHFRATGSHRLLDISCRFADHIDARFGVGKIAGVPGHPEIESALVELYRSTSEERYLKLAQYFINARGNGILCAGPWFHGDDYNQDRAPVRQTRSLRGHAVRQLYLCAGAADVYLDGGDTTLLTALQTQWRDLVETKLHITGGVGARHLGEAFGVDYELPSATAYCETCAQIASIFFSWRMLLATADGAYADLIERTLYNGFLSGVSVDGKKYFYVNPLASDGGYERPQWHGCACCPPNVMRLLASLDHYFATETPDGIELHLYDNLELEFEDARGQRATLEVETDYPWKGSVKIRFRRAPDTELTLALRVPGWCERASVQVNGELLPTEMAQGYVRIHRRFAAQDVVELELPLEVRRMVGHPRIESTFGKVAIERGPIVYCLEEVDSPQDSDFYALSVEPEASFEAVFNAKLLGGVVTLETALQAGDLTAWKGELYRPLERTRNTASARERATLVPYYGWANRGAGKMRVWLPYTSGRSS